MAVNSGLVTFPVSYSVAYKTSGLTIWGPQPPPGYAAMGCVANPGDDPPALTDVVCIATGIGEHIVSWPLHAHMLSTLIHFLAAVEGCSCQGLQEQAGDLKTQCCW